MIAVVGYLPIQHFRDYPRNRKEQNDFGRLSGCQRAVAPTDGPGIRVALRRPPKPKDRDSQ